MKNRRRHHPRRPPLAKIRPGSPAPAMGPGTEETGVKKPSTPTFADHIVSPLSAVRIEAFPKMRTRQELPTSRFRRKGERQQGRRVQDKLPERQSVWPERVLLQSQRCAISGTTSGA